MKFGLFLIALIGLQGCASSDPWTRQDTIMQTAVTASFAIDAYQTSQIQYRDDLKEVGRVASSALGSQPSTSETWTYFATAAASHWLISRAMPAKWRPYWQGGGIILETLVITSNCRLELWPCD